MTWVVATLVYVIAHFTLYALALRRVTRFSDERVIFGYHLVSELGWPVVLSLGAAVGRWSAQGPAVFLAVLSLHGIYSLTFLALWSLASGGYSIGILHYIESFAGDQFEFELRRLEQIGAGKQEARLRGIRRLGLVEEREGRFSLTKVGATCAAVLTALGWSLNVREGG